MANHNDTRDDLCLCGERISAHRSAQSGRWISCLELRERREADAAADTCTTAAEAALAAGALLLHETRF